MCDDTMSEAAGFEGFRIDVLLKVRSAQQCVCQMCQGLVRTCRVACGQAYIYVSAQQRLKHLSQR